MKKRVAYANKDQTHAITAVMPDIAPARRRLVLSDGSQWLVGAPAEDWQVGDSLTVTPLHADPAARIHRLLNLRTLGEDNGRFLWERSSATTCQSIPSC